MQSRAEVEKVLAAEMEIAKRRFLTASAAFREIITDVPSHLPQPDGSLRIKKAGDEKSAAIRAFSRAVERYHEFVMKGKLPDDPA